ncbi:calcium/sodium antiporter [Prevotella sp. S7 MS 2]|uniref:calcium/sodium antiporter n=1 Tax=Prevotella sp. S7 MS 2 TaxID=1287488 RepID=UPI000513A641|nr:calcium/sodium antiporter [Prevotella sp. S7 MS 2]KGI60762.1 sodium:proton exchanger [Prevotella sp. S7 MS 2]
MILNIVFILAGIVLVLWGADRLTDGAVALAERMNIPQIVIGLTIVAMGTSMPEFCVSLVSALKGTPDLAVGNIVGSNIFNSLLIVGVAAMVTPMTILHSTVKKDIPFALVAAVVLLMMCMDGNISRIDAGILLALLAIFMYVTLKEAKGENGTTKEANQHPMNGWKAIGFLLLGLVCLIVGSNIFVDGATNVAHTLGVSDAVIGLTIVAGGTSLPELATSVVSARKGQSGIAIGNVLGSNVFNILAILGLTGIISPMIIQGITTTDLSVMVVAMIMLWLFSFTKYTIARWEGAILTATFVGYLSYLLYQVV